MRPFRLPSLLAALALACARGAAQAPPPTPSPAPPVDARPDATAQGVPQPAVPPPIALLAGLMPLRSTGVDTFRAAHPTYDGRGVLIAILDSGLDAGTPGLITTSGGAPKVLDLRDFSGEGRVALTPVAPAADGTVAVGGQKVLGTGRIRRLTSAPTWYAGTFRELPLGKPPAADVNGNGTNTDVFPLIVVRAMDGWVVFLDTNLNGSFEDETALHDYRQGRETIALGTQPLTIAANFGEAAGAPVLDLFFDSSGHGTHVTGIAAGHRLFDVESFDGVAPGAQVIGLKIANNARGGISVHGSMVRALDYAVRFAEQRNLPLVLNMSFGVGNEQEGGAVIDSIVNAFLRAHPAVVLAVSAGNDGPGLSTLGFPGSADLALSIGALMPGPFARPPQPGVPPAADLLGWWSARGGELAKPDIVTPGLAFSSVPRWDTGNEIKGGTSMAAPHAAGLMACLLSAMAQEGRRVSAAEISQALRASARPFPDATALDQGAGVPQLEAAYRWLVAGHQGSAYVVRTAAGGSAAFRRAGFSGPGDTVDVFQVRHGAGLRAAGFVLRASAPWVAVPAEVTADPRVTEIPVAYRPGRLTSPGAHVATIRALNPSDTLAGALFTLVSTVVLPHDLDAKPLYDERRGIAPGRTHRYFLRVPRAGSTLTVSVTLSDSGVQQATVHLFEPNGQPFRDAAEGWPIGGDAGGTMTAQVRAEDAIAGVYELDVQAPPLSVVTVTARAELAPVTLAPAATGGALEVSNPGRAPVQLRVERGLVGAERVLEITGRGAPPESLTARVPDWAAGLAVDVQMTRVQWDLFTDFGVTLFDSTGQLVDEGPLNYAFGRLALAEVPETLAGRPLLVELFPAYARADGAPPWRATVRVRFLLAEPRALGGPSEVIVVPGGRMAVPSTEAGRLLLPDGFQPLLEARLRPVGGAGAEAVRRSPTAGP